MNRYNIHCIQEFEKHCMDALELLRCGLEKRSETLRSRTKEKKAGRPNIQPKVALVIYAALIRAGKNRDSINAVGEKISPRSTLQITIDHTFGAGSFDSLHIPAPDLNRRWESNVLKSLKRYAWIACFPSESFYEVELLPKADREKEFGALVNKIALFGKKSPHKKKTLEGPPKINRLTIHDNDNYLAEEISRVQKYRHGSDTPTVLIDRH